MTSSSTGPAEAARDELLARLLEELTAQLRTGRDPDVEALVRHHADLADELRELWSAARLAEDLASHLDRSSSTAEAAVGPAPGELSTRELLPAEVEPQLEPIDVRTHAEGRGGALPREFGDYELLEVLGRGGMGVVYKARQKSLDRIVALKMIHGGDLASAADRARFRAEAESAARLAHPNIVPVYEVGIHEGTPYFSMKYVAGTTLAARLAKGPVDPTVAARWLAPIARAIHYAHERGVLHRDLKPSNILLDEDGQPHVSDFGLAKRVGDNVQQLTRSGAILGTPSYMPPEQAAGSRGQLGPASDVYGLGTILYHMLAGRPPFQAASPVDTVLMVLEQDPLPPRVLNAKADRELEMVALRCLQKPPELRYPSAAALADDLEAYLAGEPVSARSAGFSEVLGRVFRETHHAPVLENWGLLWIWHSLVILVLCLVTNWFQWRGIESRLTYLALWSLGLGTWAAIFWGLRHRAGPVTFVERQIAHVWGVSVISSTALFGLEYLMNLPVLTLSPVLALFGGGVFLIKAAILSGTFYLYAAATFAAAPAMALWPQWGHAIFGIVTAICFFLPGWKYYRQRALGRRNP